MTKSDSIGRDENESEFGSLFEVLRREKLWLFVCALVAAIAAFLRFVSLELKPMHHDEGVNGYFLVTLLREGVYEYDPSNYHGPDLYFISLFFAKVFGLTTWSVRASVAIFGLLTVILALFLRRYLGKIGSIAAALFLALSPGMVYISRYFIHEILFVFFSLSFVVAVVFFIEKRKADFVAAAWMTLVLLVCFLPTTLAFATQMGGENPAVVWTLRIGVMLVEAALVFFVMRMLLFWNDGRPLYLLLASTSLVMLFATKETAFITIGTMLIACVCVCIWQKVVSLRLFAANRFTILLLVQGLLGVVGLVAAYLYFGRVKSFNKWFYLIFSGPDVPDQRFLYYAIVGLFLLGVVSWIVFFIDSKNEGEDIKGSADFFEPTWRHFREGLGGGINAVLILFAAVLVFAYVGVLFFSSFFSYADGVKGAFEAYAIWAKTGSKDHTQNGTIAYFKWLMQIESPLVVLSVLGTLIAIVKARHRFAMFVGLWAFGLFLAYTIIPYKTPWLALSFTLPMCLIAGYAINELACSKSRLQKLLAAVLGLLSVFVLGYQTYDHNFLRYDSDRLPYVYAHTERGFANLISEIERYSKKSAKGKGATIAIVSPDYWAMPWELRDYKNAVFHGKLIDANTIEMIVSEKKQRNELEDKYASHYRYVGTYPLRPGVKLDLLVRKDIAGPEAKEIGLMPKG